MFAFNALVETRDIDRIKKFHNIHKDVIVQFYTDNATDQREKVEFFENIFTPKEV